MILVRDVLHLKLLAYACICLLNTFWLIFYILLILYWFFSYFISFKMIKLCFHLDSFLFSYLLFKNPTFVIHVIVVCPVTILTIHIQCNNNNNNNKNKLTIYIATKYTTYYKCIVLYCINQIVRNLSFLTRVCIKYL